MHDASPGCLRLAALVVLASVGLQCMPDAIATGLQYDRRALEQLQAWRLFTGQLVNYTWLQVLFDSVVLLAAASCVDGEIPGRRFAALLVSGMAAISCALYLFSARTSAYRGLSGLSVLCATVAFLHLWQRAPRHRAVLAGAVAAYVAKSALLCKGWAVDVTDLPAGVSVSWVAHAAGAAWGVVATLVHRNVGAAVGRRGPDASTRIARAPVDCGSR